MGLRRFIKTDSFEEEQVASQLNAAALAVALQSTDAGHRRHSIWCAQPGSETTALLLEHLLEETDAQVQEALLAALGQSEGDDVVPALLEQLSSEDVLLRNRALEVLTGFAEHVAVHMPVQLAAAEVDKRIFLVNLMGELKHPRVADWVSEILFEEAHVNVVAAALEVAAEVGDEQMLPAIEAAQQRFLDEFFIGFAADIARQRIGVQ